MTAVTSTSGTRAPLQGRWERARDGPHRTTRPGARAIAWPAMPSPGGMLNADVALVAATDGDDPVVAGRRVAQDQRRRCRPGARRPRTRRSPRARSRGPGSALTAIAERGQPREQRRPLAERLAFARERQCRGDAVADDDHRVEIALIEGRRILAALDVEDADDGVVRPRRGTLTSLRTSGLAAAVLGVRQDVADELGLTGPHDPTDDADRAVERLDDLVVAALGSEAHEVAVARVDRDVAVAEAGRRADP